MMVLGALGISSVDAAVLCAKKSGKVLVRADVCKSRETAVLPGGAIAVVGPAGPQGATGVAGPPGIAPQEVIDATGKQFGTLLRWDGIRAQVTTTVSGVDVPLQFTIAGGKFFSEFAQSAVYYAAPGCTGAAFIGDSGGLVPLAHVVGTRAYFSRTAVTERAAQSQENEPSTPGDCGSGTDTGRQTCCFVAPSGVIASPAETFDASVLGVTPPFSLVPR
jgi:hypothetical protein